MINLSVEKLQSYLGQLIDLEEGYLDELIVRKGEIARELKCLIEEAIVERKAFDEMDKEMSKQAELEINKTTT